MNSQYKIEPYQGIQISYGAKERADKNKDVRLYDFHRKRKITGWIVTEPDGYQRIFNTKKQAIEWVNKQR